MVCGPFFACISLKRQRNLRILNGLSFGWEEYNTMQVTKVTVGFQNRMAERKPLTDEEMQREFDYYMAQKLLKKLREVDLISEGELNKIIAKNRQSFSPLSCPDYAMNDLLFTGIRANMSIPRRLSSVFGHQTLPDTISQDLSIWKM